MNDVEVFQVPWGDEPWRVSCAHCEWMVSGHRQWGEALAFATSHAAEHESRRCSHCGRTS